MGGEGGGQFSLVMMLIRYDTTPRREYNTFLECIGIFTQDAQRNVGDNMAMYTRK